VNRLKRLLLITFIESFATICVERGIYFFTNERLGFSDTDNLWLALAFGLAYVAGSFVSHRVSVRISEKSLLLATLVGQVLTHLALVFWPGAAVVFVASTLIGGLNGLKWPVVESFISAGQSPLATARTVGKFNMSWASAVPLALVAAGPMIHSWRTQFPPAFRGCLCSRIRPRTPNQPPVRYTPSY
jgi:predicted MFS family arabinose efflux permease